MAGVAHLDGLGVPFVAGCGPAVERVGDAFSRLVGTLPGGPWQLRHWQQGQCFVIFADGPRTTLEGAPLHSAVELQLRSGVRLAWRGADARLLAPGEPHADADGRWVELTATARGVTARTDALGAGALFELGVGDLRLVTNLAGLLAAPELGAWIDWDAAASAVVAGTTLSGAPWVHGASRLWAAAHRRIGPRGSSGSSGERYGLAVRTPPDGWDGGRAAQRLASVTAALAQAAGPGGPSLPLTAGRDSRVILAAALAAGLQPPTFTVGHPDRDDVYTGRRLADLARLPHTAMRPGHLVVRDAEPRRALADLARRHAGTASVADAHLVQLERGALGQAPWLTGQGGEVMRGFYGPPLGPLTTPLIGMRVASRRPGRRLPVTPGTQLRVARQIAELVHRAQRGQLPGEPGDRVYLADRMQRHFGGSLLMFDWCNPPLMPLWTRGVIGEALALPAAARRRQSFHMEMVRRLAPQLASEPTGAGEPWEGEHAGATGVLPTARATAAADPDEFAPLAAAQARLGELSTELAGEHAVWHAVRRSDVARLASAEPSQLDSVERQHVWRLAEALTAGVRGAATPVGQVATAPSADQRASAR